MFNVTSVDTIVTDEDTPFLIRGIKIADIDADDMAFGSTDDKQNSNENGIGSNRWRTNNVVFPGHPDNGFLEVELSASPNGTLALASHRGLYVTTKRVSYQGQHDYL